MKKEHKRSMKMVFTIFLLFATTIAVSAIEQIGVDTLNFQGSYADATGAGKLQLAAQYKDTPSATPTTNVTPNVTTTPIVKVTSNVSSVSKNVSGRNVIGANASNETTVPIETNNVVPTVVTTPTTAKTPANTLPKVVETPIKGETTPVAVPTKTSPGFEMVFVIAIFGAIFILRRMKE